MDARVSVVIITRDRLPSLEVTLRHLLESPEAPPVIVVDNGSRDGTLAAVRARYPSVRVIALAKNLGAAGRTVGIRAAATPYVALCDDDSWWAPGALARAAGLLDAYPHIAVVAGRVLIGDEQRLEPACAAMRDSPLTAHRLLPGPPVLGFVACGAVVRRQAYLDAGGFHRAFGVGGEEQLLAIDLAVAGWDLVYADDVVAYHYPSPVRNWAARQRIVVRNALWCAWLRRRGRGAARQTMAVTAAALATPDGRAGVLAAAAGLPWVLRQRRPVPPAVEAALRRLERPAPSRDSSVPALGRGVRQGLGRLMPRTGIEPSPRGHIDGAQPVAADGEPAAERS